MNSLPNTRARPAHSVHLSPLPAAGPPRQCFCFFVSASLSLPSTRVSLCIYRSLSLSLFLPVSPYLSHSDFVSLSLSVSVPLSVFLSPSLHASLSLSVSRPHPCLYITYHHLHHVLLGVRCHPHNLLPALLSCHLTKVQVEILSL